MKTTPPISDLRGRHPSPQPPDYGGSGAAVSSRHAGAAPDTESSPPPDIGAPPPSGTADSTSPETENQMLNPKRHTPDVTAVVDTDGAEGVADATAWYVLWVRPRSEKSVRDQLRKAGFEAYVATHHEVHLWRSKDMRHKEKKERRIVEVVVIPSIVFVGIDVCDSNKNRSRDRIQTMVGVSAFMQDPARKRAGASFWDTIARVSKSEMQLLRDMLADADAKVGFASSDFSIGENVRIIGFPQGRDIAQVVRLSGDNNTYVGLRVTFLGCAYMQVPATRLLKI